MAIPNTFTNGTIADADEVNENFSYLNDGEFAKGLTPTLSGTWDTEPTNLTNITDEDVSTYTGIGQVASGQTGYITIDLGDSSYYSNMYIKYDSTVTGGTGGSAVQISSDNLTYTDVQSAGDATNNISTYWNAFTDQSAFLKFRYIRIKLEGGTSNNTIKVYMIQVI